MVLRTVEVDVVRDFERQMQRRTLLPRERVRSPGSRNCPDGRTTGVPDTATVPARPVYPIGRCLQLGVNGGEPGRKIRPTFSAWSREL